MRDLLIHKGHILQGKDFHIRKRPLLSQQIRIGSFSLMVLMIIMICMLSLLFLKHFNNVATKGYVLRKLENDRMELIKQNEINEMMVSQSRTMDAIKNSDQIQRMISVNPEKIVYLQGETAIARK